MANLSMKASYAAHSNFNACHISSALIFRNSGKLDLCLMQHSEGHVCGCNQLKQTFVGFAVLSLLGFPSKWTVSLSALTSAHQRFLPPFFFLPNKKKLNTITAESTKSQMWAGSHSVLSVLRFLSAAICCGGSLETITCTNSRVWSSTDLLGKHAKTGNGSCTPLQAQTGSAAWKLRGQFEPSLLGIDL